MVMEMEGLYGDEAEVIKMMEHHGSNIEDTIMIGQNLAIPGTQNCGKLPKPFELKL
jgi:hypothetical protein